MHRDFGQCLSYLQRIGPPDGTDVLAPTRFSAPAFVHVLGVGVDDKAAASSTVESSAPVKPQRQQDQVVTRPSADSVTTPVTSALLTGLSAHRLPLVFKVTSDGHRVGYELGACGQGDGARLRAVTRNLLDSLYPHVRYAPGDAPVRVTGTTTTGLVLGVPVVRSSTSDRTVPWDRMLRALVGRRFEVVVLAEPVGADQLEATRAALLAELRDVAAQTKAEILPSPAADHYTQLLTTQLGHVGHAFTAGAWRTAVYLCADADSYAPLKGIWCGTYAGDASTVEPVRAYDSREAGGWARNLVMPTVRPALPPGAPVRPFEWQTLLTSAQLAAYVHLPTQEQVGFAVDQAPRFDVVRPPARPAVPLTIGRIRQGLTETVATYEIELDDLTRHAFVTGVTGAGKSHTMRHLLRQVAVHRPFLVVEPAKPEYRSLLAEPELATRLSVFTAARESVNPLRINPLHVPEGVAIGTHLDLLRSLFTASFALWSPLPQLLDRALHELYVERGFDVHGEFDQRECPADAYPMLDDLRRKVDGVIGGLGYTGEVVSNMRAALLARLEGLCTGAKGRMLDTLENTPDELLFETPAVVELDGIGDEDDQAFVIGLLMIRLLERRRRQGPHKPLRHLLVVEEAHRLLAADATPARPESGSSGARAKAVSAFTDMLAELRSYGQGILVADQIPTKLAPEVIKNTGLKIVHRLVAADDRQAMGGATVMNDQQTRAIATFAPGDAAVFGAADDAPVLVHVPPRDDPGHLPDAEVATRMRARDTRPDRCQDRCVRSSAACDQAARIAADNRPSATFALFAQSLAVAVEAGQRAWPDVLAAIAPHLPRTAPERARHCTLLRLARTWAATRGAASGWPHAVIREVGNLLVAQSFEEAHHKLSELSTRDSAPFPLCDRICPATSCLFRDAVAGVVASRRKEWWAEAETDEVWHIARNIAESTCVSPRTADLPRIRADFDRASLCAAQQMFLDVPTYSIADAARRTERFLDPAFTTLT